MLKKILGLMAILIITVVAVINMSVDMKNNSMSGMSDLSIANVEALAEMEVTAKKACKEDAKNDTGSSPCGFNNVYESWNGTAYTCKEGDGGKCKQGFVGTRTNCSGHTSTTRYEDLPYRCQ